MKKLSFAAIVVLLTINFAYASVPGEQDFVSSVQLVGQSQGAVITDYRGAARNVKIPDTLAGAPVLVIGDGAFRSKGLETVSLPATLLYIGNYAFYDNKLTNIVIPQGVSVVGEYAFDNNSVSPGVLMGVSKVTKERFVYMEPVHSTTLAEGTEIAAVPAAISVQQGYNPLAYSQAERPIVTVQDSAVYQQVSGPVVAPAYTYSYSYSSAQPVYGAPQTTIVPQSQYYSPVAPSYSVPGQAVVPRAAPTYVPPAPRGAIATPAKPVIVPGLTGFRATRELDIIQEDYNDALHPGGASLPTADISKRGWYPVWSLPTPN